MAITKTSCNTYEINDIADFTLRILQLQDDGTFLEIFVHDNGNVIAPGTTVTYTFAVDGVYNVEMTDSPVTTVTNNNVIVYCTAQECILAAILKVSCGESPSPTQLYYFNALLLAHYTFQSLLNLNFIDNWIYTTLEPHQLNDLLAVSNVMAKMTEYCTALNITDSSADCGCS